jgi:hypothetical protein
MADSDAVTQNDRGGGSDDCTPLLAFATKAIAAHFEAIVSDLGDIGGELIADIRNTVHQVAFGQPEPRGTSGIQIILSPSEIASENSMQSANHQDFQPIHSPPSQISEPNQATPAENPNLPSPSQIAGGVHGPEQRSDNGQVHQQEKWTDRVPEREKQPTENWREWVDRTGNIEGNDQNEREQGRIKDQEERDQKQEQERGSRSR